MNWVLIYCLVNLFGLMMTDNNRNTGNYNDSQSYVVGILSPSTTLYINQAPSDNENLEPPNDLNLARRNTNSFQITSVTVQGSRKNDDQAYDSADDLDESHTDDLSSDILDSSRADYEGYHSEDNLDDLASPCGQIIFAQMPNMVDRNMNLSIGVTPTFAAISPVAGGVTMMTSKSESPISAQVPIMNPLPNNWQRRFKVVKIVSSEPFQRGRWLCMDFKDPPADEGDSRPGTNTPPTIQITNCDPNDRHDGYLNVENFAQVYEIPINQTFSGNFIMGQQQHMYGIILPQNEFLQPVTLVQDLNLQTTNTDRNFNNLVDHQHQSILVHTNPSYGSIQQQPPVAMAVANNQSPPPSPKVLTSYGGASEAVLNQINSISGGNVICDGNIVPALAAVPRSRNNSYSNRIPLSSSHVLSGLNRQSSEPEESESKLSRTSGLLRNHATTGINGNCGSPMVQVNTTNPIEVPIKASPSPPANVVANSPPPTAVVSVAPPSVAEVHSSQTVPEKLPTEVGQEVDPSAGSAAPTGANTVAIDNKIEQAMDLVKSHLMFAVREEVEVLKEKITELLERISQLEHENDILRANASAETLKQLKNHKKSSNGGANTGKQQGTISPPST